MLSEKPSASNADEARVVREAAAAASVTFMEGFHYLYHPVTRRLHELLNSGELGELRAAEIDMFMPAPDDRDPRWSYELAGGALNFVEPHQDDRIIVTTANGTRAEALGRRSSYTYQLEAFAARLRDDAPLPTGAHDAVASMQLIDDCYRAVGLPPRPAGQPFISEAAR